ncbi:MerR family transcriptional regulator [Spiroplasma floricola]|uniref:MerR family transcriptional regulator n=1 Tax=Spiroplasma floricola 23-6 TaxID=1336749 RepID=A0A2K8SDX1_9MOLU|nr:MerR family transcriptional regulator [Spiroplasma floricola]AUB31657.1 MerR family transcriptional regulator [Spiroplasma floricola 23-6]
MKKLGIKELTKIFNVTEQTFRFYDSKELFPFMKRELNNYRYANFEDLQWFKMVFILRDAGMEIKKIKEYLNLCLQGDGTVTERFNIIVAQKNILLEKINNLKEQLDLLNLKELHYKKIIETGIEDEWNPINFNKLIDNN